MKYQSTRIELAIFLSILLHVLLVVLFFWISQVTPSLPLAGGSGDDSDVLDAVMVDTGQVATEYGRLVKEKNTKPEPQKVEEKEKDSTKEIVQQKLEEQKQQEIAHKQELERQQQLKQEQVKKQEEATSKKIAEAVNLKAEAEAKRLEAAAKQAEEERKMKEAERKIQQQKELKEKVEKEAKEKAEKEAKEKADKLAKEKAEKEAKEKAEKEAKEKADKLAKEKAKKEAKEKAEQDAKAKSEKIQNNKNLEDLMNGLDSGAAIQGGNQNKSGSQGSGGTKGITQGGADGDVYGQRIKRLIESRYRVDPSFAGKQCDVKIFLERDGTIKNYQVLGGSPDVCNAAVNAILATKKVPPAPSDAVYERFKSPTLDFSLKIK